MEEKDKLKFESHPETSEVEEVESEEIDEFAEQRERVAKIRATEEERHKARGNGSGFQLEKLNPKGITERGFGFLKDADKFFEEIYKDEEEKVKDWWFEDFLGTAYYKKLASLPLNELLAEKANVTELLQSMDDFLMNFGTEEDADNILVKGIVTHLLVVKGRIDMAIRKAE